MTPTHHSLIHALSTCLTYIKQELTSTIEESAVQDAPALLGCSRRLQDIREMLEVLCDIIQWVRVHPLLSIALTDDPAVGDATA